MPTFRPCAIIRVLHDVAEVQVWPVVKKKHVGVRLPMKPLRALVGGGSHLSFKACTLGFLLASRFFPTCSAAVWPVSLCLGAQMDLQESLPKTLWPLSSAHGLPWTRSLGLGCFEPPDERLFGVNVLG